MVCVVHMWKHHIQINERILSKGKQSLANNCPPHEGYQKTPKKWHSGGCMVYRVAHFLCHNLVFYKMACIYMLLTWNKNNYFPNFWLDLDFQLEKKHIYKQNCNIYIQIYNSRFLKLKNWTNLLFVLLYTCIFIYEFYFGYIIRT